MLLNIVRNGDRLLASVCAVADQRDTKRGAHKSNQGQWGEVEQGGLLLFKRLLLLGRQVRDERQGDNR